MQDDGPPCKQSRADSSLDPLQTSEFIKQGSSITNAHDSIQISDFTNNSHISEEITIYWVTIFGFPPEKCKGILELFSRHGDIVSKKVKSIFFYEFYVIIDTDKQKLGACAIFFNCPC
jgi:hypothetical protein